MNAAIFIALLQNAGLLLALVLVFELATTRFAQARNPWQQAGLGCLLGALGVGVMLVPFVLAPGIVFDTRSVLLAVTGLYFGLGPTLVAVLLTAAVRLGQGGAAAWPGVAVIVASAAIGLAWRHRRREQLANLGWRGLYGLGLVVHAVMLALMLTLGWSTGLTVIAAIGLPVILIHPVATMALALLLGRQLRQLHDKAALRDATAMLRMVCKIGHLGGWKLESGRERQSWTDELAAMHDLPPGSGPTVAAALGYYAPEWREQIGARFEACTRDGVPYDEEWRSSPPWAAGSGCARSVSRSGRSRPDCRGPGDPAGYHRVQPAPAGGGKHPGGERARLASALDRMATFAYMKDRQGRYIYANQATLDLFKCTAEELRGRDDRHFFPPETVARLQAIDRRVMEQGEESTEEIEVVQPDGSRRHYLEFKAPIHEGDGPRKRICGVCGVSTDITARKRAAESNARQQEELRVAPNAELEHSRSMLQLIIESIPLRVFWKGADLRYQGCNTLFARDGGFRHPAEMVGQDDYAMAWKPLADNYRKDDREVMASRQAKLNFIEAVGDPAGDLIWVRTSKVPLLDAAGAVVGMVGMYEDITEQRRLEQKAVAAAEETAQLLVEAGRTRQSLLSMVEDLRSAEHRLQVEQELAQSTLDTLQEHICVVDAAGIIIAVNQAWSAFGAANGLGADYDCVGLNYLEICARATGPEAGQAADFSASLQAVLAGRSSAVEMEYPCNAPGESRWFIVRATRFAGQGAVRAVIAHENITARKRRGGRSGERGHQGRRNTSRWAWRPTWLIPRCFEYMNDRFPALYRHDAGGAGLRGFVLSGSLRGSGGPKEDMRRRVFADCASGRTPPADARWEDVPISRRGQETTYVNAQNTPVPGKAIMISTVWDVTARKLAEEALRATVRDKEALLKEVHHRVKNNLQVITSLLRLEAGHIREPGTKVVLREMQDRIRSMALLHETLYRSGNYASVNLSLYLRQLTQQLFRAHNTDPGRVHLVLDLAPVQVEMDQAIPCGLIVNELAINSLKHAFCRQ
ncbi:MAG: PAS domain-containing protein [Opitutaceae bacterium]|nr:PAS domain-containing protein [Opitutaceae bacterium]